MSKILLYSVNTFLKHHIIQRYRNDVHYVWCSEEFDCKAASRFSVGAHIPPSSNPADLIRRLSDDVRGNERHSDKIDQQIATLSALAIEWCIAGSISEEGKKDIIFSVNNAEKILWRPLLYVIRRDLVSGRLKIVPASKRAGLSPEYIIEDLASTEFDVIDIFNA